MEGKRPGSGHVAFIEGSQRITADRIEFNTRTKLGSFWNVQGFHLNGVPVGVPKPVSRQGQVLEPGPTGRIPEGRYYVQAGHPDSLDSRYQLTGWIHASQIIGRADALF